MLTSILQDILTPTDITQLKFQLSDFLSISPQDDREISFLWHDCQGRIKDKMKELAISRYQKALSNRQGPVDPDYEPSSQGSKSPSHDSS